MWSLCQKIANLTGTTKDDVYRDALRQAGSFRMLRVAPEREADVRSRWASRGTGWIVERADSTDDYDDLLLYYGTSTYTDREMNILLDYLRAGYDELQGDVKNC